jgi:hypothetical protein
MEMKLMAMSSETRRAKHRYGRDFLALMDLHNSHRDLSLITFFDLQLGTVRSTKTSRDS